MEEPTPPNSELEKQITKLDIKFFLKKKSTIYVFVTILFLMFFYYLYLSAPKNFPKGEIINIPAGLSLRSISKNLKENNIISSRVMFETFSIIYGGEKSMESGDYYFENKIPVFEVARRISKGDRDLAPVKVTIPEGFNVSEIAELFTNKLPNFKPDQFLLEAREGYLFPDTYFFFTTDNEKDVILSMTNNFNKKILSLKQEIDSSGRSLEDIIIMASLIEKESKGDEDREYISGILWKRLDINMPLQVDAEPNTYKEKGLPKKPIANPGFKSIKAAIKPQKTNYLYYLHDKEGNIHYASNFEQHKANKFMYLK